MRKLHIVIAMLMLSMSVLAQQKIITGIVSSKTTSEPLEGVTVQVKNTAVVTDPSGKFSIQASPGEIITVSYVGMNSQSIKVTKATETFNVALEEGNGGMEQIVVTGYKAERKKDITGAVSIVNINETTKESNINILTSLQGRVP